MGQYRTWCFRPVRVVACAGVRRWVALRSRDQLADHRHVRVGVETPLAQSSIKLAHHFTLTAS